MFPSDKRHLISSNQIAWFEENLAGQRWDVDHFVDPTTLIHISIAHRIIIYFMFILADLKVHGIDLFKNICSVDAELCYT